MAKHPCRGCQRAGSCRYCKNRDLYKSKEDVIKNRAWRRKVGRAMKDDGYIGMIHRKPGMRYSRKERKYISKLNKKKRK